MRRVLVALVVSLATAPALATRAEQGRIDALIAAIGTSGCQFERNGSVYPAGEGASHLRSKLDRAGDRVQSAAQFIDRVASGSSQSGKPYRVLCPGQPPQLSRQWLEARLADLIAAGK